MPPGLSEEAHLCELSLADLGVCTVVQKWFPQMFKR
jgi:hypothetical protein